MKQQNRRPEHSRLWNSRARQPVRADRRASDHARGVANPAVVATAKIAHGSADVLVVDGGSRVRRPTLTVVMDVHCRTIVGFHLSS